MLKKQLLSLRLVSRVPLLSLLTWLVVVLIIKLGEGVAEIGGLMVIGSERHESRRIDNQLRGRSGRQGDQDVHSSLYHLKMN